MIRDKKSYNIMIIEDNPGDLAIVEDFLNEQIAGPVLVNAVSFKQAAAFLSSGHSPFDVILLDLTLPDRSGQHLITEILLLAPHSPIIILTGYADIEFSIKSISQGVLDYLLKDDLNALILYKSIVYAIERKKNMSELKESEKRYSDLFNLSPQPMWVFDIQTLKFTQVNRATISLYGYSEEEFLNMSLLDINLKTDNKEAKDHFQTPLADEDVLKKTILHHKKNGELIEVELYSTSIIFSEKLLRSVIAIDVTEKKLYEHRIIKAIINTQEDERYKIGGELHDNICQILATAQLNLDMLEKSVPLLKKSLFDNIGKYIKMAIEEIRNISHRLAPAFFDDTTLEEAFGRLFSDFNVGGKYRISFHFNSTAKNITVSLEIQLNFYRILQEQLRNIEKYSNAKLIDVDVAVDKNKLSLRVTDDGIGFELNKVKKGIGLANMKRRAELFHGNFEIISSPGKGCELLVEIPLTDLNQAPSNARITGTDLRNQFKTC